MVIPPLAFFSGPLPWVIIAVCTVFFLWVDLHFFARGREPSFREGVIWSIGWLVVSLLANAWFLSRDEPAVGFWRSEAGRAEYVRAYDRAMAGLPPHEARDVRTDFGTVRV